MFHLCTFHSLLCFCSTSCLGPEANSRGSDHASSRKAGTDLWMNGADSEAFELPMVSRREGRIPYRTKEGPGWVRRLGYVCSLPKIDGSLC